MTIKQSSYTAENIEVLEGLEPVRHRPGMYIGGTDETAYHHLAAEIIDNSMDEAVAGYAKEIIVELLEGNLVQISDDGRGIPTDKHPKFTNKSALEVILTTLHSGGKFKAGAYTTSGGLHGVGMSVVNALSDYLLVTVNRDGKCFTQEFSRGIPSGAMKTTSSSSIIRGTKVKFHPDPLIFGTELKFIPSVLYNMAKTKSFLQKGIKITWKMDPSYQEEYPDVPLNAIFYFPNGLEDYINVFAERKKKKIANIFSGSGDFIDGVGKLEWVIGWWDDDLSISTFCNTIPTPQGGTHETGLRNGLLRAVRSYCDLIGNKNVSKITSDDVIEDSCILLSVFINNPQFQGQTKEKLTTPEVVRLVEVIIKDKFELWLMKDKARTEVLLNQIMSNAETRLRKRMERQTKRQTVFKRLRLPGKLADCSSTDSKNTELYLVEGDSAGGSAKMARDRKTQAILPLKGKILNVASASDEKLLANQEIKDIIEALGCGSGKNFNVNNLRYDRIIIMTDADVDGAHIASLLMTFFFKQMPELVNTRHLYLAVPPLYRISGGSKVFYARDDFHKEQIIKKEFKNLKNIDISRFKGLGEMPPSQLKETTMNPSTRTLLQVIIPDSVSENELFNKTQLLVEDLMGRHAEKRYNWIQAQNPFNVSLDV